MELPNHNSSTTARVYWRVEGSLADLTTVRPVAFFTWNAQTFLERWVRRGLVLVMAVLRPFLYAAHRGFATRVVHTVLRGISRDRLDLLGEEYFKYKLQPYLKSDGVELLKSHIAGGDEVVLVSQGLEHVMRPLAQHLGVKWMVANRLEFRDGIATGRLLEPVVRPRGLFAGINGSGPDGRRAEERLVHDMGLANAEVLRTAVIPASRQIPVPDRPIVYFEGIRHTGPLSVRRAFAGKHVMLIGVTGFIGKVWLVNTLMELPEIGRIYLLIRRQKSNPALRRFEKLVEESPVFDPLYARYGADLSRFLRERVEIIEGDVCQPGLGLAPEVSQSLQKNLDLIINSSGLTDFNPDLRDALATNVDAAMNVTEFVRQSDHAGLLHLSTCYVAGARDGRVGETMRPDYTPAGVAGFDAENEWRALHAFVKQAEQLADSTEVTEELRQQALSKEHAAKDLGGAALENQIRKNRFRWLREYLTESGMNRAAELGWPNTYTLTKSLAESLISKFGSGLPIAVVRPAIVETSVHEPFVGWNEGINTSASLSYLLGTSFPPASYEREEASRYYSGGFGLSRHDADRRGAYREASRAALSAGHFGDQSVRYAAFHRADLAGASQTLPRPGRTGILAAAAPGCYSSVQGTLQPHVCAGAEGDCEIHPAHHVASAAEENSAGPGRTQFGKSGETHQVVRAVHSAQ